jgi:FKBP-type peptidyl-prolyl cis-trans isomerase 2
LASILEKKYPTLKIEEPWDYNAESIKIGDVLVSDAMGNYNPEAIMDIVYEQLNKTETEEAGTEVQTTGNSMAEF